MTAPQILKTDAGDELVVLSRRDYDALLARAGDEDAEDRMTGRILAETAAEVAIPEEVWAAFEAGANRLHTLRIWRKMTQTELSAASGVAQPNISAMEAGTKGFSAVSLQSLAKALGVSRDVLMGD